MGVGSSRFGSGKFGSTDVVQSSASDFNLLSATVVTLLSVDLLFSDVLDTTNPALVDPASYSLTGGLVTSYVEVIDVMTVRVHFYVAMATNKQYTITIVGGVTNITGNALFINSASFFFFEEIRMARRVNANDHWNPGFGIVTESYDDI